jgi:L-malate glycosyltransferase
MRVLLLSDANSIHTKRWVAGLNELNVRVGLWSISLPTSDFYKHLPNVKVFSGGIEQKRFGFWEKANYLTLLKSVRSAIKIFRPELVHAHYASSYGLLGALSNFRPFILSVWGSDVYEFPKQNHIFKEVIKYNFRKADVLLSTSHAMACEAKKYTSKTFQITPFGIDIQLFTQFFMKQNEIFTIGTVKTLEKKYGIDLLIKAFHVFKKKVPEVQAKLRIVGEGSLLQQLVQLTGKLGISEHCQFVGKVPYESVPKELEKMDVCVCLSRSESFGVAAIEASAMELPVIVSNVGGLPEVIKDGETGIVVPNEDYELAAEAIIRLYKDKELRTKMGKAGRNRVHDEFDWKENLQMMKKIYADTLKTFEE